MGFKAPKLLLGWREWLALPELEIDAIKAKVDTGARTSALHADDIRIIRRGGEKRVRFRVAPLQSTRAREVEAPFAGFRRVRSSSGALEERPVITTEVVVGEERWPIEITLTARDMMGFRMLLGRQALRRRARVDPDRSFLTRPPLDPDDEEPSRSSRAPGRGAALEPD